MSIDQQQAASPVVFSDAGERARVALSSHLTVRNLVERHTELAALRTLYEVMCSNGWVAIHVDIEECSAIETLALSATAHGASSATSTASTGPIAATCARRSTRRYAPKSPPDGRPSDSATVPPTLGAATQCRRPQNRRSISAVPGRPRYEVRPVYCVVRQLEVVGGCR